MMYEQVFFLGTGRVGSECLRILKDRCSMESLTCLAVEKEVIPTMQTTAKRLQVPYIFFEKNELKNFLMQQEKSTLLISAHNQYIFPKEVVEKYNLKIINFHNAYLPFYRGRNAPTWEIYNDEKFGGATWHEVNASIDTGKVIVQEKVLISQDEIALSLLMKCAQSGISLFKENVDSFLSGSYSAKELEQKTKLYKSNELPNEGFLDTNWDFASSYKFLRSMDYQQLKILPPPKINLNGNIYDIGGYELRNENVAELARGGGI